MADLPMSDSNGPLDPEGDDPTTTQPTAGARPAPRGTAFYQRRRAVKACQVCRARRTKCDNLKPSCSFCLKVGATCIQSAADLSSFDPASLKILERLDDLEKTMKAMAIEPCSGKAQAVQASPGPGLHRTIGEISPPGPDHIMTWAIFQDIQAGLDVGSASAFETCVDQGNARPSPVSALGDLDMDAPRVNRLLDNFFNYVHVKNPILNEQATRQAVQSTVLNGIDWSPESCLSLLICALGSLARPFQPSLDTMPGTAAYASAQSFFQAAQRRIGVLVASDDIIAPQCLFLSGVYMMCTFQPVKAWRYFVQALACCQQLSFLNPGTPLHPCGNMESAPQLGSYSSETLQQAVYWSSWKSEREMRGGLCLPDFSLTDKDLAFYPPFMPTPPTPDEVEASTGSGTRRQQISWYFYLAEISLRRLASRLHAEVVGICEQHATHQDTLETIAAAVPEYEEQAQEWIASLPACLSFDAPADEDDVCRFVLRGHAINLFEMIYWPFISAHLNQAHPNAVLDQFSSSSGITRLANRALEYHACRLAVNRPGYRHRHHGTLLMMQSCSRSALVLVASALLNLSRTSRNSGHGTATLALPQGWRTGVDEVIGMLSFWENETPQLTKVRYVLERARAIIP